jgi:hypothetical protein
MKVLPYRLMANRIIGLVLMAVMAAAGQTVDLAGKPRDPFASPAAVRVFLFVRTDCPLTNRYAPELQRIAAKFQPQGAGIWLVYPDPAETAAGIEKHIAEYRFPGTPLRDPHHELVKRAQASIAPEAAVFDKAGRLVYIGRIDDRFVDFGKARQAPQTHDLEDAIAAVLAGQPVPSPRTRAIGCYLADVK